MALSRPKPGFESPQGHLFIRIGSIQECREAHIFSTDHNLRRSVHSCAFLRTPVLRRFLRRLYVAFCAADGLLEMLLGHLEVMLAGHGPAVTQPLAHHMGGEAVGQVRPAKRYRRAR